jgi:hypothetical protein
MTARDFSFQHTRIIPAGAGEAAPVSPTDPIVWDLAGAEDLSVPAHPQSLILLAQGGAVAYEVGFWNATVDATASFIVADTGTLVDGAPKVVSFPAEGARIYVRSTGVTAGAVRIYCSTFAGTSEDAAAILAGLATEATLQLLYARQADGAQKSTIRGAAKGFTVAADVTSTQTDANHQALDVTSLLLE